jgi:hypothetical protein
MTIQGPPAGWHPDPSAPGQALRWWDGSQWTAHTQPAPPAAGPYAAGPGFAGPGFAAGQVPPPGALPPGAGHGLPVMPAARPPSRSFTQGNTAALGAIGFALLYLVLAAVTHIVFIGILPVVLAVRALQQRETLAPVALAAAAVAVVVGVTVLAHH